VTHAEVQELIAAVAKKHKLVLGLDDPVLVTVTLNELLLAKYVEKVNAVIETAGARTAAGSAQQIEAAKTIARQIVTGAGDYIAERVKSAALEAQSVLAESGQKQIAELHQIIGMARSATRAIWLAAATAVASLSLVAGIGIGYWIQH
jgi:hypothetical protein